MPAADLQATLQQALALHQQGRLADAERLYAEILARQPDHFDALHLAGVAAAQSGRAARGVELIERAIARDPIRAEAHANLGNALKALGNFDGALASYDRAIALKPDHVEAIYSRAALLAGLGRRGEAIAGFERAVALRPDLVNAHLQMGLALLASVEPARALASFDKVAALRPASGAAHAYRGDALSDLGRYGEAVAAYDEALRRDSGLAEAHANRALALVALGRCAEALTGYDRALALRPDEASIHNNRGAALNELRRHEEAIASFDRALALQPGYVPAHGNRGIALSVLRRHDEALASYERAIALDPGYADAHYNRGSVLLLLKRYSEAARAFGAARAARPDCPYARGYELMSRLQVCDWRDLDTAVSAVTEGVRAGRRVISPFPFLAVSSSVEDQRACAAIYAAHKYPSGPALWRGERYRHDKIRLAYLSADFHDHPVAYLAAELFELHDRTRFDVRAYSFGPDVAHPMRERLKRGFDSFHDVSDRSDREVASMLRAAEIDIAIDLKGYTDDCRPGIFALRPAPVQIAYLGYPGTMGAPYFDYVIADATVIPPGHEGGYSEKIIRMPYSYQANDRTRAIAGRVPTRRETGLPDRGFVFCCFNQGFKILPTVFDIWMRLLAGVEGSVLWLFRDSSDAAENLRREAAARGIEPRRLIFADRVPLPEHLARHQLADLFLDTLPYNAHTTASDALWAGLPVLTCRGSTFAGRVAASLLAAVGLPELIAGDMSQYEGIALALAREPARLAALTSKLRATSRSSPLFAAEAFTRDLERGLEAALIRHQQDAPPTDIAITRS